MKEKLDTNIQTACVDLYIDYSSLQITCSLLGSTSQIFSFFFAVHIALPCYHALETTAAEANVYSNEQRGRLPFSNMIQRNLTVKLIPSSSHKISTVCLYGPSSVWGQHRSFEEWFEDLEAGLCHKLASPLPRYYIFPSLSVSSSPLISFPSVAVLMGDKNSRPPWSIPCLDQSHIYFLYSCPGIWTGFPLFFNWKF